MKTLTPEQLNTILEDHRLWLEGKDGGKCADLIQADLSDIVLSDATLRYSALEGAVLIDTDLRRTDLREADLTDANLSNANLSDAVLVRAELTDGELSGASLIFTVMIGAVLVRAKLRAADLRGADLSGAVLIKANLRGADLRGADLSDANLWDSRLSGANLRGAKLEGAYWGGNIPVIENIHQKVYEAASKEGALNMGNWHNVCGTTHCRAGWVVTLAGERGRELEKETGPEYAAYAIYAASDPDYFTRDGLPNFFTSDEDALTDMKRLSELEATQ